MLPETPPAVCIIGRKNSGKTTLTVAVAAELRRRGLRIATIKHGHHAFETDQHGRDSWRHFNQGEAEATLMVGTGKLALVMRREGEPDPARLVEEFYSGRGYHLVLIEGWKRGALPCIEIFRAGEHAGPLFGAGEDDARRYLAVVSDRELPQLPVPVLRLAADGSHAAAVADLLVGYVEGASHAR